MLIPIRGAAAPVYNLFRDPREKQPLVGLVLSSGAAFQIMIGRHKMTTFVKHPRMQTEFIVICEIGSLFTRCR